MLMIVRKLTKKLLSVKVGRVIFFSFVSGNIRSLFGILNVLAVSIISKILTKMVFLKLLTIISAKVGTIRLMMN